MSYFIASVSFIYFRVERKYACTYFWVLHLKASLTHALFMNSVAVRDCFEFSDALK